MPRSEKTSRLRDPNHNNPHPFINQEVISSLGAENPRPKLILVPSSGDKIPDDNPRTLKQSETSDRNRQCPFPSTALLCNESGQEVSLPTSRDGIVI